MRLTSLKNAVLGIGATIMYPIVIMLEGYSICLLISQLR